MKYLLLVLLIPLAACSKVELYATHGFKAKYDCLEKHKGKFVQIEVSRIEEGENYVTKTWPLRCKTPDGRLIDYSVVAK